MGENEDEQVLAGWEDAPHHAWRICKVLLKPKNRMVYSVCGPCPRWQLVWFWSLSWWEENRPVCSEEEPSWKGYKEERAKWESTKTEAETVKVGLDHQDPQRPWLKARLSHTKARRYHSMWSNLEDTCAQMWTPTSISGTKDEQSILQIWNQNV